MKAKGERAIAQIASRANWLLQVWPVIKHPATNLRWRHRSLDERLLQVSRHGTFLSSRIAYEKAAFRASLKWRARKRPRQAAEDSSDLPDEASTATNLLGGVPIRVPVRQKWSRNSFDRRLLTDSRYPLNLGHFRRLLACGGTMIDIGAHVGSVSVAHALLGDFRRIHAIEAVAENFRCLEANIEMNGLVSVIVPHHCAMGAEVGEASIREGSGSGQHQVEPQGGEAAAPDLQRVPLLTLDRMLERIGRDAEDVSFVKCDTEGHDPSVLLGARQFLSSRRAVWQIEFCPRLIERRAALSFEQLYDLLEANFDHFIADSGPSPRMMPISDARDFLSRPLSRNHIDLFLIPRTPKV